MDLLFAAFVSFRFREIKFFLEKLNSFWIKSCISQSNCILHLEIIKTRIQYRICRIPISFQTDGLNLLYFNISGLRQRAAKI